MGVGVSGECQQEAKRKPRYIFYGDLSGKQDIMTRGLRIMPYLVTSS